MNIFERAREALATQGASVSTAEALEAIVVGEALFASLQAKPEPILRFFSFDHLPAPLRLVSQPFCDLAHRLHDSLPPGAERAVALRKLLESKDAAVRASLPPE